MDHWLVLKKTRKIKKKTHLGPKRRVWRRLGPFSSSLPSQSRISSLETIYAIKTLVDIKKYEDKIRNTHLGPKRHVCRRLGPFSSSLPSAGSRRVASRAPAALFPPCCCPAAALLLPPPFRSYLTRRWGHVNAWWW